MATKKSTVKRPRVATGKSQVELAKLKLDMPLDEQKLAAIQKCLKKGRLTITVDRVNLTTGRFGDGWLYD
jgi:hypothetical protein